jgi:hypothetical protein
MSADGVEQRHFIITPTAITQISDDGERYEQEPSDAYGDLVLAGFPLNNDASLGGYFLDVAVRGERAVAFTCHPPTEWDMGEAASALFVALVLP